MTTQRKTWWITVPSLWRFNESVTVEADTLEDAIDKINMEDYEWGEYSGPQGRYILRKELDCEFIWEADSDEWTLHTDCLVDFPECDDDCSDKMQIPNELPLYSAPLALEAMGLIETEEENEDSSI